MYQETGYIPATMASLPSFDIHKFLGEQNEQTIIVLSGCRSLITDWFTQLATVTALSVSAQQLQAQFSTLIPASTEA